MVFVFHFVSAIGTGNVSLRVNRVLVTCKYYLHLESYTNRNIHVPCLNLTKEIISKLNPINILLCTDIAELQKKKMLYVNKRYLNWKIGS